MGQASGDPADPATTTHPTAHPTPGLRDDLVALLRSSPFHEWTQLRGRVCPAEQGIFDAAAAAARAQWTTAELTQQLKHALIAVSTEAVRALPQWSGQCVRPAHLDRAATALQAASELATVLALLPDTSTGPGPCQRVADPAA